MTTTTTPPRPPFRPVRVRPLWERADLFLEPAYPEGAEPLEEDDPEGEESAAIITP